MTLLRTQIREALLAVLQQHTPYRVFNHAVYPLAVADLPAVTVLLEKENRLLDYSTLSDNDRSVHTYELPIVVEGLTQGSEDLQRACEDMALKVMAAFHDNLTLGGLCKTLRWEGVEVLLSHEGEQPIGKVRLSATVLYRSAEHAPEQAYH
jgi:hypothetical protein